ncbi:MAG TPA: hypothetical protein VF132_01345 [Rudaea sp.]
MKRTQIHYRIQAVAIFTLFGMLGGCAADDKTVAGEPSPPAPLPASMTPAQCEVWEREASFANSVDRHDVQAFSEHIALSAVFVDDRNTATIGRDAIVKDWQALVAGDARFSLHWHPQFVQVAAQSAVGLSYGQYWLSFSDGRYAIGTFVSTWIKESDGKWRVLYDGGAGHPAKAVTREEVEKLRKSLLATCLQQGPSPAPGA